MSTREKSILAFSHHQNPLIHASSIRVECLQPINRRQVEAGIGEGHQLPVDQIPVAFGRVMAFSGSSMVFCVRVSASGSAVPVASMLLSGTSKAGNPAGGSLPFYGLLMMMTVREPWRLI